MTGDPYDGEPILQILGSKRIAGTDRFLLSDGQYKLDYSRPLTQQFQSLPENWLPEFTIIQVTNHTTEFDEKYVQQSILFLSWAHFSLEIYCIFARIWQNFEILNIELQFFL